MKKLLTLLFLVPALPLAAQKINNLHYKAVVADTHNDCLSSLTLEGLDISLPLKEGHSDLYRWKKGGLDVQFFSVWTGEKARSAQGFFHDAMEEIDSLTQIVQRNLGRMLMARNMKEVKKGIRQKKLVSLIGVEGGHMIENDLNRLQTLYDRGMRYLTLTWNNSTDWASSAKDETEKPAALPHKGLTEFGRQVVKRMNELGVLVDLSHTGEQTFYDALAVSTKPVLLSHSSVWNICPVFRNLKDEQIQAVAKNRGVICINFYSGFIDSNYARKSDELEGARGRQIRDSLRLLYDSVTTRKMWRQFFASELEKYRPTLAQMVDHIDYIVNLVGDDYVGIGSDYDGVSSLPRGLEDVTTYPAITEELIKRGYSKKSIRKILGRNVLRVMQKGLN